ncbi:MAG TPA: tetraacyldisaccharide 4'-kinase, partial [Dongiaceae bacterium]|nr:tetraacyldisaccharide 4'-kinase [Dongiaceae bacterium]
AGRDPASRIEEIRRVAPAAGFAAGRHRVTGAAALDGGPFAPGGRVRVVTATGHPRAVAASAAEHGFQVTALSAYRDHHWFTAAEAAAESTRAARDGARVLLTAKDAIRWPARDPEVGVLEVAWEWVTGGDTVERAVFGERA